MSLASLLDRVLPGRAHSFSHGVHPETHKQRTQGLAIESMPLLERYFLPLSQHGGAPSVPCVEPGSEVRAGQEVARADGFRSVALHSPVAGRVRELSLCPHVAGGLAPALVVETDPYADPSLVRMPPIDPAADHEATLTRIQQAGVVGLGGAAYPAHAKMRVPEGKRVEVVVLNGAECEPYLTSDHRVMVERAREVISGLAIILELEGASRGRIGVEVNKPDAIEALREASAGDPRIDVVPLRVKYPEGAKQMMIEAVAGIRVPLGGRSVDAHVTIHNVATAAAVHDAVHEGRPMVDRVLTVTGPGVRRPANVRVRLGTPLSALFEHCGGLLSESAQVIVGGAMMGQAQSSLQAPLIKGVTGVLALNRERHAPVEEACIRCGRCLEACAMFLNPSELAERARSADIDALKQHHVSACFECGSCAFVCPSHIPLTALIRTGKAMVRKASR